MEAPEAKDSRARLLHILRISAGCSREARQRVHGGNATCVSVSSDHVQDGVSGVVARGCECVWAKFADELFDVFEVAVAAGEKDLLEIVRRWD